jgi:hypothetical protein
VSSDRKFHSITVLGSPDLLATVFPDQRTQFGMTILIGATKMLATLVSVFRVDEYGRRPLVLASSAGLIVGGRKQGGMGHHMCMGMRIYLARSNLVCNTHVGTRDVLVACRLLLVHGLPASES